MASERNDKDGISRRDFTSRIGAATAGLVVGGEFFRPSANAAPHVGGRMLGANDKVVTASIGIRGQGNALKRGFAQLKNVEIKTLCDIDGNLAPERINDARLKDVPTFKPKFEQDLRRVLDDKDIDAVVIATPNQWHALATVWALQAGKHVYVEKPASYTVWEGRKMVEAAARYNKIVQVGTMNRSRPAVREAIKFIHEGGIGKVYMARGLCFKPRPSIGKYPDGPMAAGEKYALTVTSKNYEPTYDAAYLSKVDYDLWLGPAAEAAVQPQPLPLQLALALGVRQRRHRQSGTAPVRHRALGPEQAGASRSRSARWADTSASRPRRRLPTSIPRCSSTRMARFWSSQPAATTPTTRERSGSAISSTGPRAGSGSMATAALWQSYMGPAGDKNEKGKGSGTPGAAAAAIRWF